MTESDDLHTQIEIFQNSLEIDEEKLFARLETDTVADINSTEELFHAFNRAVKNTSCYDYFLDILRHLILTPSNPFLKYKYFMVFDKLISQVVLQKDGEDPDPEVAVLKMDVKTLFNELQVMDKYNQLEDKFQKTKDRLAR
jgi:hypothetical protein